MASAGDITFKDVFVPDNNRLEYGNDFLTGTVTVLMKSRLGVAWCATSIAIGAYESCLKYCINRHQFGKPIASFQLV